MRRKCSITIFMSLALSLLISFSASLIGVANVKGTKAVTKTYAKLAAESVMARYYYPLFDRYHIFAWDMGEGARQANFSKPAELLRKNLNDEIKLCSDTFYFKPDKVQTDINSVSMLLDNDCKSYFNQAVDYMKYLEVRKLTEDVLDIFDILEKSVAINEVTEKQSDLMKTISVSDRNIIKLMSYADGIAVNKNGVDKDKNGKIKTIKNFIKGFYSEDTDIFIKMYNNKDIFRAVNGGQINLCETFTDIYEDLDTAWSNYRNYIRGKQEIDLLSEEIKSAEYLLEDTKFEIENLLLNISECKEKLETLLEEIKEDDDLSELLKETDEIDKAGEICKTDEAGETNETGEIDDDEFALEEIAEASDTILTDCGQLSEEALNLLKEYEDNKRLIKEYEKELKLASLERENLSEEITSKQKLRNELHVLHAGERSEYQVRMVAVNNKLDNLKDRAKGIRNCIKDAIPVCKTIINQQKLIREAISVYDTFLKGKAGQLTDDVFKAFESDLIQIKSMYGMSESDIISQFDRYQATAQNNLEIVNQIMEFEKVNEGNLDIQMYKAEEMLGVVKNYSNDGMWFDYKVEDGVPENERFTLEYVKDLLSMTALNYIGIDTSKGFKILNFEDAPSVNTTVENPNTIGAAIDKFRTLFSKDKLKAMRFVAGELSEAFLFEEYINYHFMDFLDKGERSAAKCEREYILFGQSSDYQNLECAVGSVFALRYILDFAYILSNPAMRSEAGTMALTIASCIGLPVVTTAIKYALIGIWAFTEAAIDTSAIMEGKEVAIWGVGCPISLAESFVILPATIKAKAALVNDGLGIGYETYLSLFSLFEKRADKCLRSLDIIQENLQMDNRKNFMIKNCVTGIDYTCRIEKKSVVNIGLTPMDYVFSGKASY